MLYYLHRAIGKGSVAQLSIAESSHLKVISNLSLLTALALSEILSIEICGLAYAYYVILLSYCYPHHNMFFSNSWTVI
jgi:hypothetical protein